METTECSATTFSAFAFHRLGVSFPALALVDRFPLLTPSPAKLRASHASYLDRILSPLLLKETILSFL